VSFVTSYNTTCDLITKARSRSELVSENVLKYGRLFFNFLFLLHYQIFFLFEGSTSHTVRHRHKVVHFWMSHQRVAEAATYTTQKIHKRGTSLSSACFEPAIPAIKRPQICALDGLATRMGITIILNTINIRITQLLLPLLLLLLLLTILLLQIQLPPPN
jgi:hypothetical protein